VRRRLTLVTVGVVALALVLSGLFTLVLVGRAARDETRRQLADQALDLADQAGDVESFRRLANLTRALELEGVARVRLSAAGVEGELPEGISPSDLRPDSLRRGEVVSGIKGSLVFAAVAVEPPAALRGRRRLPQEIAVVLTRRVDPGLGRGGAWFALSATGSLVLAAVVADRLGRRIAAPLEAAEGATRRIAAGDLDARVDVGTAADEEVASLARSINTMAANLGRARRLERQFLLAVSHDLRTPLTSIRGYAEAIADGAAPDHERAADVIASESRRLERLVGDLLELAKLDARRFSLDLRPVDPAEVVLDTAEGFQPAAEELGITLAVHVPGPGALEVTADPDRLAQVVANLVENALKFAATEVTVTASSEGDEVVVAVLDDGPGIDADDLPHVFERLYQSGRAPARRLGSGLGLAIVAELVEAMGGSVGVESQGAGGTRIVVRIPSLSPSATAPESSSSSSA
jgi:signal transduction histidine kinase